MCPIITHEDELELATLEKELADQILKMAKAQTVLISSQKKYAENLTKANLTREMLNRTFRDVLKQMQTLVREKRSNVKNEEVKIYEDIIHKNDQYIEVNNRYMDAIKNLVLKKEYLVEKKKEFAEALKEVADIRSKVIKKALFVEKSKNKLIEGEKIKILDAQLNDLQRAFDRARDVLLKKITQFLEVRDEVDDLWLKLKETISKSS
ncbi:MAG: hypothetical protein ACTSRH_04575 [Promethearchaeota archaeon]